ncbi:MAG TPA: right-handed parallel beta-helix repeat-containing protein [Pyrinomonadaceae bacterium]|nr:right-handed parallel beta-helix repeat-containing protein [Pyrinomonadaceae bacterium]
MNKFRFTMNALAVLVFTLAFVSIAQAQATRTWVSGVGDDANPCSRTAPCKTFAGAISKTAACGEIDCIDPGGFGAVTITKSITIDGTGTFASILGSLTNAININAANTDVVTIRGLSLNGACNGLSGINVINAGAKTVNIEDCVIFRFTTGISVNVNGNSNLNVRNTVIRDNSSDGANLFTSAGFVKASFEHCSLNGNANGLHARSLTKVTARNCVFANNSSNGVFVDAATGGFSNVFVWASQISLNGGNGIQAGNGGNTGVSGVTIAQNQIDRNTGTGALISTGGVINTFSNNSILGNANDVCGGGPACTPVGPGG